MYIGIYSKWKKMLQPLVRKCLICIFCFVTVSKGDGEVYLLYLYMCIWVAYI